MILRQARISDARAICAITNAVIRDKAITFTTKERGEANIAADIALRWVAYQVVENDGQVVGFATYGRFRDGPGYENTREMTIQLAPEVRRRGMGRALLQQLEDVAIAQGVHVLLAGISGGNTAGLRFHAACGFVEAGRLAQVGFKAGQWQDLILMQKILPANRPDADSGAATG